MSEKTNIDPRPRICPICPDTRHDIHPLFVDVTYCPRCGVPRFFPAGYFAMDGSLIPPVVCSNCKEKFRAAQGGGVGVVHPMRGADLQIMTPRGVLHNRVLAL